MSNEIKIGRSIGAAVAFSAAIVMAPSAFAMSELEELMGEPVSALSDNELGELRGGFVTVNGLKFNIGVEVSGSVRRSTATLDNVRNRIDGLGRNVVVRRREDMVEQALTEEITEVSIDGALTETSSSLTQVTGAQVEATTKSATGPDQMAVLTDDTMSFTTGTGTDGAKAPEVGSSAAAAIAGNIFDVQVAVIDADNSNVLLNRVVNLDIANYSVIDAMAARTRIESKITNVIHSQVLFQLGQQF